MKESWIVVVSYARQVVLKDKRLGLSYTTVNGEVSAMAIVTSRDAETLGAVLDQHSHQDLGKYKTENAARKALKVFEKKWHAEMAEIEACRCDTILPPPRAQGLGRSPLDYLPKPSKALKKLVGGKR